MALPTTENMSTDLIPEFADKSGDIKHQHQAILSNANRASGSSMYTFGDNIVQCLIFGPNPLATSLNLLKKNYFSVFIYPLGKIRNMTKDKDIFYYEHFFRRAFGPMVDHGQLPRSRSLVVLNELEKGSAFLTTCLNATSLGLLDSGYPLSYFLGSTTIILDQGEDQSQNPKLLYSENEYRNIKTPKYRTHEPAELSFGSPHCPTMKARFHFLAKNIDQPGTAIAGLIAEGCFSLDTLCQAMEKSGEDIQQFFHYSKDKVRDRFG